MNRKILCLVAAVIAFLLGGCGYEEESPVYPECDEAGCSWGESS